MAKQPLTLLRCVLTSTGSAVTAHPPHGPLRSVSRSETRLCPFRMLMMKLTRRSVARTFLHGLTITLGSSLAGLRISAAGEHGCLRCGCRDQKCCKVCRLVKEDRKITTTCWGMKDEDFCVPAPSTPDCKHCEPVCQTDPKSGVTSCQKRLVWTSWIPGCGGDVMTRHKLMKKTVTKTVPSFKWVVEDLCPKCVAACEPITVPDGTTVPQPPRVRNAVVVACNYSHESPASKTHK